MLVLLQVMFTDLDFQAAFHIELDVLENFLFEVYCHYNSIPFHNFRHCFCVTQMVRTGRRVLFEQSDGGVFDFISWTSRSEMKPIII